jgi:hypothetical protein
MKDLVIEQLKGCQGKSMAAAAEQSCGRFLRVGKETRRKPPLMWVHL